MQLSPFIQDIASGFIATVFAAFVTLSAVAQIKVLRLKREFHALADLLRSTYDTRCVTDVASQHADRMEEVKNQLKELLKELSAAKEGVLSFNLDFKKDFRLFEKDLNAIIEDRFFRDLMRLLSGSENTLELEYREKIKKLSQRSENMAEKLWFGTLMIP